MYNLKTKNEILSAFVEGVKANKEANLKDFNLSEIMKTDNVEKTKEAIEKIRANVIAAIPEGIPVPAVSVYITPAGLGDTEGIALATISVTNRLKAAKKFKYTHVAEQTNSKEVFSTADFFEGVYSALIEEYLAEENLKVVNEVLAQESQKAEATYKVQVVSSLGEGNKTLAYLDDDVVIYVADAERVFELDDILALVPVTEDLLDYEKNNIESAKEQISNTFAENQTTVQFVNAHGGALIQYLCNLSSRKKALNLIRKLGKSIDKIATAGSKDGIFVYEKDHTCAIIARENGEFKLALSPFDTETYKNVDKDVLAEIA